MRWFVFFAVVAISIVGISFELLNEEKPTLQVTDIAPKPIEKEVPTSHLDDAELRHFHESTESSFAMAPGVGRHRGGAHVLLADSQVKFLSEASSVPTDPANIDSYGMWGSLGTRRNSSGEVHGPATSNPIVTLNRMPSTHYAFEYLTPDFSNDPAFPWKLAEALLVSVDRHQVYLAEQIGSDNFSAGPTRELNSFEATALDRLLAGDSDAIIEAASEVQMLGALRNRQRCTGCHDREDNALLGALSYRFTQK